MLQINYPLAKNQHLPWDAENMQIFDMFTQSCCQRHLLFVLKFSSFTMKTRLLGTFFS